MPPNNKNAQPVKMDLSKIIKYTREGLTYPEIAERLGTTTQVIKNTVYRASTRATQRGAMSSSNIPRKRAKKVSKAEVGKIAKKMSTYLDNVSGVLKEENKGRATAINVHIGMCVGLGAQVDIENINSLYAAFENYLRICAENDVPLTMSSACLACGVKPSTLATWRRGKARTGDYKEFAESVTYAVQAGIEAMMATGLLNPVVGIWWEKSHFSMIESNRAESGDNDPLGQRRTAEEIAEEYSNVELPD